MDFYQFAGLAIFIVVILHGNLENVLLYLPPDFFLLGAILYTYLMKYKDKPFDYKVAIYCAVFYLHKPLLATFCVFGGPIISMPLIHKWLQCYLLGVSAIYILGQKNCTHILNNPYARTLCIYGKYIYISKVMMGVSSTIFYREISMLSCLGPILCYSVSMCLMWVSQPIIQYYEDLKVLQKNPEEIKPRFVKNIKDNATIWVGLIPVGLALYYAIQFVSQVKGITPDMKPGIEKPLIFFATLIYCYLMVGVKEATNAKSVELPKPQIEDKPHAD